jgi:hypothetical protein
MSALRRLLDVAARWPHIRFHLHKREWNVRRLGSRPYRASMKPLRLPWHCRASGEHPARTLSAPCRVQIVPAVTKRRIGIGGVINRTAKRARRDQCTWAKRRTINGLVPYFGGA